MDQQSKRITQWGHPKMDEPDGSPYLVQTVLNTQFDEALS